MKRILFFFRRPGFHACRRARRFAQFLSFIFILFSLSQAQLAKMSISGTPQKSSDEIVGKRDANGRFCAAIQVISDMDGFKYQSYNGVVDLDDQPGKDMVYLQPDERVLEIYKSGYEPLKIILSEYGVQLKPKAVWKIKIKGEVKTGDLLPVTVHIQPGDAFITIDGKTYNTGSAIKLSKGSHKIRISRQGYKTKDETINVTENNVYFNYTLSEVELEQVVINSTPAEARIYLDNVEKGVTDKGLFLYPGQYRLKLIKEGYVEINETITVAEGGLNNFSYSLSKNSGTLALTIEPANAKILINREDYSSRSNIELAPGRYKIEISKTGYHPQSETVTIERGKKLIKRYALSAKTGKLQFNIQPLTAKVTLKQNGRVMQSWTGMKYIKDLQVGNYELECSASGYAVQKDKITINEQRTTILEVKLKKGYASAVSSTSGGNMVFIKGGSFRMGSNDGESDEKPVHTVTVNDFYIGKYEVSQRKWREVMGSNPSYFKGDNNPVEKVSWYDAVKFCNKKSANEGLTPCYTINGTNVTCNFNANGYRLPTEAEWEYAAKGGQNSRGYKYSGRNNIGDVAWYTSNSGGKTHPAGKKKPNELGIYDMSGNVWEWCNDWYGSDYYKNSPSNNPKGPSSCSYRVVRGGCWYYLSNNARAANRYYHYPDGSHSDSGFRFVRAF